MEFGIKKKAFETVNSSLLEYNGETFRIIRELGEDEFDKGDVGRMFVIQFGDGFIARAFIDEVAILD